MPRQQNNKDLKFFQLLHQAIGKSEPILKGKGNLSRSHLDKLNLINNGFYLTPQNQGFHNLDAVLGEM